MLVQGVIDLVHILVQYGFIGKSSGGEFNVDVDYIKKQLDKKVGNGFFLSLFSLILSAVYPRSLEPFLY